MFSVTRAAIIWAYECNMQLTLQRCFLITRLNESDILHLQGVYPYACYQTFIALRERVTESKSGR